ncbi:MAG: adenylate/guanylate cyclase domain-containing protein [Cyanobacteria bacterium P01_G01_bin.54]
MIRDARQKQVLKEAFGQYVDPRIVETLMAQQANQQGRKEVMTVFFSDLAKFSTISEMLTPTRLVTLINQYLTLATVPITETQGVIDKFIGDAIVAFWGPPFVRATEHAQLACQAALEQASQLRKLQQRLPEIVGIRKGIPKLGVRVGLDTGELVLGNIGTEQLQSYTVMGRTVEIAEQLESANKRYGTQILLTERTRKLAGEAIEVREIDYLPIGDDNALLPIYELLAFGMELDEAVAELKDAFSQGLQAYRQEDWSRARSQFETCLKIEPNDGPATFYLQQLSQFART